MKFLNTFQCELIKITHSMVFWLTFVFFGVSMTVVSFGVKPHTWQAFFATFTTLTGNMMMLGTFFIAAWLFGMEFSEGTNHDLIAKPISRLAMVLAKFTAILIWGLILAAFLFGFGCLLAAVLGYQGFALSFFMTAIQKYSVVTLFYLLLCPIGALIASLTRRILAPVGVLFVLTLGANVIGDTAVAKYFPWTVPAVFEKVGQLTIPSILILGATCLIGLLGTIAWWRLADQ